MKKNVFMLVAVFIVSSFFTITNAVAVRHYCFDKTTGEVDVANSDCDTEWVKRMYSGSGLSNLVSNRTISEVDERIYLGPNLSIIPKTLHEKVAKTIRDKIGITHVLDCTVSNENSWLRDETDLFKCYELPMLDDPSQKLKIDEAIAFIKRSLCDDQNNKIYIHCYAGASRSASVVTGYLIDKAKADKIDHSFESVYDFVKRQRPAVKVNVGFENFLRSMAL